MRRRSLRLVPEQVSRLAVIGVPSGLRCRGVEDLVHQVVDELVRPARLDGQPCRDQLLAPSCGHGIGDLQQPGHRAGLERCAEHRRGPRELLDVARPPGPPVASRHRSTWAARPGHPRAAHEASRRRTAHALRSGDDALRQVMLSGSSSQRRHRLRRERTDVHPLRQITEAGQRFLALLGAQRREHQQSGVTGASHDEVQCVERRETSDLEVVEHQQHGRRVRRSGAAPSPTPRRRGGVRSRGSPHPAAWARGPRRSRGPRAPRIPADLRRSHASVAGVERRISGRRASTSGCSSNDRSVS